MSPVILRTAVRVVIPLLALLSVFLLLRGHDEPGGGFVGGLLLASALALHALAFGVRRSRALLPLDPKTLTSTGLVLALLSGGAGLLAREPFLTGLWLREPVPGLGKLSTVLAFDVGVFLVVVGTTLLILFELEEEDS